MPLNRLLVCHAYISSIKLRQIFNSIYTPVYLENTQIPERANRAIPGTHISSRSLIHSEVREKLTLQPSSQTRLAVWVTAVIVSGPFTCDIMHSALERTIYMIFKKIRRRIYRYGIYRSECSVNRAVSSLQGWINNFAMADAIESTVHVTLIKQSPLMKICSNTEMCIWHENSCLRSVSDTFTKALTNLVKLAISRPMSNMTGIAK